MYWLPLILFALAVPLARDTAAVVDGYYPVYAVTLLMALVAACVVLYVEPLSLLVTGPSPWFSPALGLPVVASIAVAAFSRARARWQLGR